MARKLKYNEEEGGMAKAQLQKIEMYAAKLNEMIHPEDELEGWVQNKLSVVAAYMGDVKHYLDYALQNEPEYKEFANGGMTDKPRYWEVEFTWSAADEESRKVNVMAESVSDAEEQVRKKFGPYYEGLKVVEVEEDKEMSWEEYAKRPKKFEIESTTDYDVIEADDEEEAKKEWMRRRKGDSYKSELLKVRRRFAKGGLTKAEEKREKELREQKDKLKDEELNISMGIFKESTRAEAKRKWEQKMIKINTELNELLEKKYGIIKKSDGGMVYDIEWKDEQGETYENSFLDLQEAKDTIAMLKKMGYRITQTWKYRDGEYVGSFADGGMMKPHYIVSVYYGGEMEDETFEAYTLEEAKRLASKGEHAEIYDTKQKKVIEFANGGTMRYEGSTMEEDMKEAEEYIGKEVWDTLSSEDKDNATKYLRAKGVIGFQGQEEELADFMASQYAKGGSLYRGMRPSPSISATAYPKGFKMIGNDGNLWEISVDSRGVHRWTKSQSSTRDERMQQKAKIREAIELLESLRDEVDVEDEIKTLKKLQ